MSEFLIGVIVGFMLGVVVLTVISQGGDGQ